MMQTVSNLPMVHSENLQGDYYFNLQDGSTGIEVIAINTIISVTTKATGEINDPQLSPLPCVRIP